MVKATNKRQPPPRQPRVTRVWDKLDIKLSDRAIERDVRIVQQRILALSATSCTGPQDTTSMDSASRASAAQPDGRKGAARSRAGSEQPYHTTAQEPGAQDQQERLPGAGGQQWRSRSTSPTEFVFPPMPAAIMAHLQPQVGPAGPPVKAPTVHPAAPMPSVLGAVRTFYDTDTSQSASLGLAAADLGWEGCGQQQHYHQGAASQQPAYAAYA